jgi:hypothetical protein
VIAFLSGSESVHVLLSLVYICIALEIYLSIRDGYDSITSLTLSYLCASSKPGPGSPTSYANLSPFLC